jgi:hypothetical protein
VYFTRTHFATVIPNKTWGPVRMSGARCGAKVGSLANAWEYVTCGRCNRLRRKS